MKGNFYNNPLKILWYARKVLLPFYLIILWIFFLLASLSGIYYFKFIDLSTFQVNSYFSISSTGLTFTLALFVAGKNAFSEQDLKKLAKHKNSLGITGQPLIDFIGPFVFTAILFLSAGIISLFCPFIKVNISLDMINLAKIIYMNILLLGILSLFNLIITMLNDVYSAAFRE